MFGGALVSFVKRLFGRAKTYEMPPADEPVMTPLPSTAQHRAGNMVLVCRRCGQRLPSSVADPRRWTLPADSVEAVCCCQNCCGSRDCSCNDGPGYHAHSTSRSCRGRPRSMSSTAAVQCQPAARQRSADHVVIPPSSLPLPPSIARSPDGEEGYTRYQRRIARFNRSTERDIFRPPPNRTIGHVTERGSTTTSSHL